MWPSSRGGMSWRRVQLVVWCVWGCAWSCRAHEACGHPLCGSAPRQGTRARRRTGEAVDLTGSGRGGRRHSNAQRGLSLAPPCRRARGGGCERESERRGPDGSASHSTTHPGQWHPRSPISVDCARSLILTCEDVRCRFHGPRSSADWPQVLLTRYIENFSRVESSSSHIFFSPPGADPLLIFF